MTHSSKRACSVFAYYGTQSSTKSAVAFFDVVTQWLASLEVRPDKMGVTGDGFSGKIASFGRTSRLLLSRGFDSVQAIEIIASSAESTRVKDFVATALWGRDHGNYVVVGIDANRCNWSSGSLLGTAKAIAEISQPHYGIGFERDASLTPVAFALGIGGGRPGALRGREYEDAVRRSAWSHGETWDYAVAEGLLRDIFPLNFLNATQLRRNVDGASLESWIRSRPERGTLASFTVGLTLWKIDDARIPTIFDELWNASAIFNPQIHRTSSVR